MFKLDHDYHIHTSLSTCCHEDIMTPENIVPACKAENHMEIVLTNHFWDSKMPGADDWYGPQDLAWVKKLLPLPKENGMKIRFGCETEFCGGKKIGISPESYDEFEFIIVPFTHLHNNFSRPVDCTTPEQVANLYMDHFEDLMAIDLPWKKVGIPHLTCPLVYPGPRLHEVFEHMVDSRLEKCFTFLAKQGTGIELNASSFRPGWEQYPDTFLNIYRIAKAAGCKFYVGSDAHAVASLKNINQNLPVVAEMLGLTEADRYYIPD